MLCLRVGGAHGSLDNICAMCTQVLKEKMDVMRLTFYTAPVSVGILVPFFLLTEFKKLLTYGCAFTTAVIMNAACSLSPAPVHVALQASPAAICVKREQDYCKFVACWMLMGLGHCLSSGMTAHQESIPTNASM